MARLLWSVLCQRVITDRQTNLPSYIDLVEGFRVSRLPHPFPPVFVATNWKRDCDDERLRLRLQVVSPSGGNLLTREPPPVEFGGHTFYRFNVQLAGIQIEEPGTHEILIEQHAGGNWLSASALICEVSLEEQDRGAAPELDASHQPEA